MAAGTWTKQGVTAHVHPGDKTSSSGPYHFPQISYEILCGGDEYQQIGGNHLSHSVSKHSRVSHGLNKIP